MQIIEYFASERQAHWLAQIKKSEWDAGQLLYTLLAEGRFRQATGARSRVLLLTEGDALMAYCTYAEKDDIQPTDLTPWMGFVFTFPPYRGHHYAGVLMQEALRLARAEHAQNIYISTGHVGLYEKYGCELYAILPDLHGAPSRVYVKRVE